MKPLTAEWVAKAEGDFSSASRELRARSRPNYDAACFHAQQCVEKYLKALLQEAGVAFPKTHNLVTLLDLLAAPNLALGLLRQRLAALNAYGILIRYPGKAADKAKAREAVIICRDARKTCRLQLGLARA